MAAELKIVDAAVAAAAPAHPIRSGQAHSRKSPTTFRAHAVPIILRGVTA
eukprot:CAMPEP_0194288204 /NCGR_PEP_ID=MMETSP0169-20130528/36354_1 /TAXON_ID=218684 /ORGANISM="Corethron pennatum, Strain L29A3" /LENGTH=49 /DNA_ID= /DNA_START= /DNA_END= /DNA_ORIENTATION=